MPAAQCIRKQALGHRDAARIRKRLAYDKSGRDTAGGGRLAVVGRIIRPQHAGHHPDIVMASAHLTKSRYTAGLQCLRRLWLRVHEPQEYEEPPSGSPMAAGHEIGRHAHKLFPGGVLVDEEPWQHSKAVARTAALMADITVPAIFEAAFVHGAIRIRIDVLERHLDGWGLREVKSSTRVKDHHLDDVALQAHVLAHAGVPVHSAEVLHVDNAYVRGAGELDWPAYFARVDVGNTIERRSGGILAQLLEMHACLQLDAAPPIEPSGHCHTPQGCEFWDRCTADKPVDWVRHLPRLSAVQASELKALGIEAVSAIPAEFRLTAKQAIIRDATASGQPYVASDLAGLLRGFAPPACYLDFEAMMPSIPLWAGTRPYQTIPFQWSLHAIDDDGSLHHREFLAASDEDPRRRFAETLIAALDAFTGPILVYSAYEQTRLTELAGHFPELGPAIKAILARLLDLLPIVRGAVYLPEFSFSNSIKSVAPALSPGFGYDDLGGIADGAAASTAFLQLASGVISQPGQVGQLRAALLAYCRRDTLAMVEVHRALMQLAADGTVGPG